jgi:hypothetical protein
MNLPSNSKVIEMSVFKLLRVFSKALEQYKYIAFSNVGNFDRWIIFKISKTFRFLEILNLEKLLQFQKSVSFQKS